MTDFLFYNLIHFKFRYLFLIYNNYLTLCFKLLILFAILFKPIAVLGVTKQINVHGGQHLKFVI